MTTLLEDIRWSLADTVEPYRWSDDRLNKLIYDAQFDINRRLDILREEKEIALDPSNYSYLLPSDFIKLLRVEANDKVVPLKSHAQMDKLDAEWETTEGDEILYIVYDKQNRRLIKIYPKLIPSPDEYTIENSGSLEDVLYSFNSPYGVIVDVDEGALTSIYGIATEIDWIDYFISADCSGASSITEGTPDSDYGLVAAIIDYLKELTVKDDSYGVITEVEDFSIDTYGETTDIKDDDADKTSFDQTEGFAQIIYDYNDVLKVFYIRKPKADTVELDDLYYSAIKYYVLGYALRDDMDTQNRALGNENLQLYHRELQQIQRESEKDFTNGEQYTLGYRDIFEEV